MIFSPGLRAIVVSLLMTVSRPFVHQLNAQGISGLEGKWRGEFIIRDGIAAPFNFEIRDNGKAYLINGKEIYEAGQLRLVNDSVFIPLDQFDNELALKRAKNTLHGVLRKQDHTGAPIPLKAEKNKTYRFPRKEKGSARNIAGRYELMFELNSGKKEKGIAVFEQQGHILTGTFLKPSGDARFLEGIVDGNRFYLSSFIGSSPGYYAGTITEDGKISGAQTGTKIRHLFSGFRNDTATLADAFNVSRLKEGQNKLEFSLPDINGKQVSLSDPKYKNKVVIIAITGTWCPNCIDEAAFLSPWYEKNRERGVEIITIHYERQSDTAYARKVMSRFRKRFDITYDQVFGGIAHTDSVKKSLPALAKFSSFPTTIFVGKNGNVSKIHTGYTGPATGKFYDEFLKEFNDEVDSLLKE